MKLINFNKVAATGIAAAVALVLGQATGYAQPIYTLSDANSSAQINTTSQSGMFNWFVDGQNQLNQQWFWIRNGSGVPVSLDSLTLAPVIQPSASTLVTTYFNSTVSVQITYSLLGGGLGSGTADIGEQIKIQNLTGSALTDFHFYQYADFSVGGTPNNSIVQLGKNLKGLYGEALVTSGNVSVSENVDSALAPGANHGETELYSTTLNKLQTSAGLVLDDVSSNGPGHATWAFEWDRTSANNTAIAAGGTFIISKDLNIAGVTPVPEPATLSLISVGLAALGALQLRRGRTSRQ